MTRVSGTILIVLGMLVVALSVLPSGLAGQLNGVGVGSDNLLADVLLGLGVALLLLGGTLVLSRGPAPSRQKKASPDRARD